ncbi:MAG: septum formation protein Maf [Alphaproteobacteria bacterium]|nr:septum formation protein Maf [Alphaproteobacteria bacterium]
MTDGDEMDPVGSALSRDAVVLASSSRWRLGMLEESGLGVHGVDPGVDEDPLVGSDPVQTARLRALAKARAVARRFPEHLVIGADQVLWQPGGDEAIGKPVDDAAWRARLAAFRGAAHQLTTAVAIEAPAALGGAEAFEQTTTVRFRDDIEDAEIEAYVALGEARGCAGGYMIESRGAWLVAALDGDMRNVIGLPVLALVGSLRRRGWRLRGEGRPTFVGPMR